MENLTFIVVAVVVGIMLFGPHTKSKPKDDKKGDKGKK